MAERSDAGFSLVEVLVSLALLSLISLLLLRVVGTAGLLSRLGNRMASDVDLAVVRDRLQVSLSRLAGQATNGRRPPFGGEPQEFTAMVQADRETERGGVLREAVWAASREGGTIDLVESRDFGTVAADGPTEVLVRRAMDLQIRYFGAAQTDRQPHWSATWSQRDRPPALVEITLSFRPGDRRKWPPLVVPLGVGR